MNSTKSQQLLQYSYLLKLLVGRNVKNQYYRSFLGVVWTVLNPLLNMIVMALVFSTIFGRDPNGLDYPVYILSGNIVFGLMRSSTSMALTCLVSQRGLLQKTRVPVALFPTSNVFSAVVTFGFSLIALVLVMLVRIPNGAQFHWEMLMIVVMLPALILFSLGLSYFLSACYVFFRDLKHIYSVFLTLWMYMTPLFYTVEQLKLSATMLTVLKLNPMYHFVTYFRTLLMGGIPTWQTHLIIYGVGFVAFGLGILFLKCVKKSIATRL